MSRFFRSLDSDASSSDGSSSENDDDADELHRELSPVSGDTEDLTTALSGVSLLGRDTSSRRDLFLHTLLERNCLNEVLNEHISAGRLGLTREDAVIQAEARARYQRMCGMLAPLNLIPAGLEHDRFSSTRQQYNRGLDMLSRRSMPSSVQRPDVPVPLRRLLADSDAQFDRFTDLQSLNPQANNAFNTFQTMSPMRSVLEPSRYLREFVEMDLLGKGGYGVVYSAKNRIDLVDYAIKKIPISQKRLARIQARGQEELDELLQEVRMLAKIDHPNIVRYFNAWIDWSDLRGASRNLTNALPNDSLGLWNEESQDALVGAEDGRSNSLHRIVTQSGTASHEADVVFETSVSRRSSVYVPPGLQQTSGIISESEYDDESQMTSIPTWTLHVQMSLHPLTLADFISPPERPDSMKRAPVHCFHLQPTIHMLLSIMEGVEYLHSRNVVHRDLKPANIFMAEHKDPRRSRPSVDLFLCSQCRAAGKALPDRLDIRIGDFGLVTEIAHPQSSNDAAGHRPAVGTEIYRPAVTTSNASPSLDIFALGIIAFEMLWKFETRMERHETIQSLKNGIFPARFLEDEDPSGEVRACIRDMLSQGEHTDVTIQLLKQRLSAVESLLQS